MKTRYSSIFVIAVIFLFCLTTFLASLAEARGRGGRGGGMRGGGGFSRSSPAAGGGFSSRSAARQPQRQMQREMPRQQPRERQRDPSEGREDRQEHRDEAREDRQDHRDEAREDRQDFIDDEWDDHHHDDDWDEGAAFVTGMAVGAAMNRNKYVYSVPCSTTVIVGGITYYHCASTWYSRGYEGGEVVYIITTAPAGY